MSLNPDEFLWITVISIFSIIILSGIVYILPFPKCDLVSFIISKTKIGMEQKAENVCMNGCQSQSVSHKVTKNQAWPILNSDGSVNGNNKLVPTPGFITGPQGHGFYTSGPWKIDIPAGNPLGLDFSQTQIMMAGDYYGRMGPSAPNAPEDEDSIPTMDSPHPCQALGPMICTDSASYWNPYSAAAASICEEGDRSCGAEQPLNDSLIDISTLIDAGQSYETDSDMMMVFI